MQKKKAKEEDIAYESVIFQRLNKSLESGLSSRTTNVFTKLATALVSKRIISKTGRVAENRESCLEYLEKILPFMTFSDFAVLDADPETFIERYVFSPSERKMSLATYLQDLGILDEFFNLKSDLGWRSESSEIFDEFREQYEISPFEKIDKYIAINFWGTSKDTTIGPSELYEDWERGIMPLFTYLKYHIFFNQKLLLFIFIFI